MDGLEFTAEMFKAAAWPAAVIAVAAMFRSDIKKALGKLRSFEGPGLKAAFSEEAKELASEAADAAAPPTPPQKVRVETTSKEQESVSAAARYFEILRAANRSFKGYKRPIAQVLDSWAQIEALLAEMAVRNNVQLGQGQTAGFALAMALMKAGLLSVDQVNLIDRLYSLRNRLAMSDFEPSDEAANNYASSARSVKDVLTALLESGPPAVPGKPA